ncbi:MAG: hypothetical protein JNK82_45180 [Myxococcaceae bacterium]|nr:hypothetical protein [Myxococcaceae bacterium]
MKLNLLRSALLRDVPTSGDAVLVTPQGTTVQLARVLVTAVMSLADVLRHQPTTFVFRFGDARPGIVFSEPAPRPVVELLADVLDATEQSVRLEQQPGLVPVMRISRDGLRVYSGLEEAARDDLVH